MSSTRKIWADEMNRKVPPGTYRRHLEAELENTGNSLKEEVELRCDLEDANKILNKTIKQLRSDLAAERERCAKIAENMDYIEPVESGDYQSQQINIGIEIAAAIRAQPEVKDVREAPNTQG